MIHQHLHIRRAHHAQAEDDAVLVVEERALTVTRTVMSTLPATFTGAIGGHSTLGVQATKTSEDGILHATSSSHHVESTKTHDTNSAIYSPQTSVPTTLAVLAATSSPSAILATSAVSSAAAVVTSSAAASSAAASGDNASGMSVGGKAGLAIGIILGLSAVLSLVMFCFRQRKKAQERQRLDDEKSRSPIEDTFQSDRAPSTRTARTASTAPRLSLRPVTQLFPMFSEKRSSRGNELETMMAMSSPSASHLAPQSAWGRPSTSNSQNDTANPFGNHAEPVDPTNAEGPAVVQSVTSNGPVVAAGTTPFGATGLARGASKRENAPKQIDFTKALPPPGPPSPSTTDFSVSELPGMPVLTAGSNAIAAAGGPVNAAVHRVQLDFQPSMDDELELIAGQLIRLLHEYDDGWVSKQMILYFHILTITGFMYSSRPLTSRSCSTHLSFHPSRQTSPSTQWASRSSAATWSSTTWYACTTRPTQTIYFVNEQSRISGSSSRISSIK